MKKVMKVISGILFCLLFVITTFFVGMKFLGEDPSVFGYSMYYILTGSMEPQISAGDIIISETVTPEELVVGDVITYKGEVGDVKGKMITHEIIDITEENGEVSFITKGCANIIEDPPVYSHQIVSKMTVKLPFVGKIFSVINSKWGFFIIIIVPLAVLLIHEVVSLVKTIRSGKEEQNDEEQKNTEE